MTDDSNLLVLLGHFGSFAKRYPLTATLLATVGLFVVVLGLVAGFIRPEQMPTVRTRAAARIVHRYGLAVRGSWRDWKALFSGMEDLRPAGTTPTPGADVPEPPPARSAAISAAWEAAPVTPREGKRGEP